MKLAIIGPSFFGYLEDISDRLNARGLQTRFFDERKSNSVIGKLFARFSPVAVKQGQLAAHVDTIIDTILLSDTTHVLLVSVEVVTKQQISRLKKAGLTLCRYGWDSVRNKPKMYALDSLMDHIASFDPEDCATHGYIPIHLFSAPKGLSPAPPKTEDFFYCTTLHSNRPQLVMRLKKAIAANGFSDRMFLFYHSRLLWALRYAYQPTVWPLLREVSTEPFSLTAIAAATHGARVVIDIHHGAQSGLTMRTFEALSLEAILLTTNRASLSELPTNLAARVVLLDPENLDDCLRAAVTPATDPKLVSLTDKDRYALSIDRFLDQITALLKGDSVPEAFKKFNI